MNKICLNRKKEQRIKGGHLWIFSNEVNTRKTPLKDFFPGEQVLVESHGGEILGTAYINPKSLICGRIVSRERIPLDFTLLQTRIAAALKLRQRLFAVPYYRMVYGESDLLPGLVVDRYGSHLTVQLNTAGMEAVQTEIIDSLISLVQPQSILLKNDSSIRSLEGLESEVKTVHGSTPLELELIENGVTMLAPLLGGQKTGWFYDQRPNRAKLSRFVADQRVLDVFSYVGSFAIQAAAFGAREVWAVDASRFALEIAEKNAARNGAADKFTGAEGDAFDVLKALREEKEHFDVIVIDPPAFIKRKKDHREGLRAYRRINELAMKLLKPEGILLSASCSMHLARHELIDVLRTSGQRVNRHVQILEEGSQGPDHPIHPAIPETCYIKAFLVKVT